MSDKNISKINMSGEKSDRPREVRQNTRSAESRHIFPIDQSPRPSTLEEKLRTLEKEHAYRIYKLERSGIPLNQAEHNIQVYPVNIDNTRLHTAANILQNNPSIAENLLMDIATLESQGHETRDLTAFIRDIREQLSDPHSERIIGSITFLATDASHSHVSPQARGRIFTFLRDIGLTVTDNP